MGERIGEFSSGLKRQVRREQKNLCAVCGRLCDGKHEKLQIHHIVPLSLAPHYNMKLDEIRSRRNALGVCEPCHKTLDELALNQGFYFDEAQPSKLLTRR